MEQLHESNNTADLPARKKHSGLGIASFIISLVCIIGIIGTVIAMAIMLGGSGAITNPAVLAPEEPLPAEFAAFAGAGFALILFIVMSLVGAILGIIGLFQKERLKLFAILGTVFNSLVFGSFAVLIIIGLVIGLSGAAM